MVSIAAALKAARLILTSHTANPHLESEILLAHVLNVNRTYLQAWSEKSIEPHLLEQYESLVQRRAAGEPSAYITGEKEFWSLSLHVTPSVLIPRPETELLVESVLAHYPQLQGIRLADLGTGSGAIALALQHERPAWEIIATDQDEAALQVAKENAERLGLSQIQFYQGNWCEALPQEEYDLLVSNPPYIAANDPELEPMVFSFEPTVALIAEQEGLAAFDTILVAAPQYLKQGGRIYLEHGRGQAKTVHNLLIKNGFSQITTLQDLAGLDRVTYATYEF